MRLRALDRKLVWKSQCQIQQTLSSEAESKPVDVLGLPLSKEDEDRRGSEKKRATFQPSQNQDLLRWSKAAEHLSTQ